MESGDSMVLLHSCHHAKTGLDVTFIDTLSRAGGATKVIEIFRKERTAALYSLMQIVRQQPRAAISGGSFIIQVKYIFTPFPDIPDHVIKLERIGPPHTHRLNVVIGVRFVLRNQVQLGGPIL